MASNARVLPLALGMACLSLACTEPQKVARAPGDITVAMAGHGSRVPAGDPWPGNPTGPLRCDGPQAQDGDALFCFDTALRTWQEADEHCRLIGGRLADVRSVAESSVLRAAFGHPFNLPNTLWIGLVEPFRRNEWGWMSGERATYQNWGGGEPNDAGGGEDCGERISRTGQWNDIDCASQRGFLCEGPALPAGTPLTSAAIARTGFKCLGIVVQAGNVPYCLYTDRALSLADASTFCKANGGQVAEPSTAEKDRALLKQLGARAGTGNDVWIGITDAENEGVWRTTDGNTARFAEWRSGEPNNAGARGEDCAMWGPVDGKWNDVPCDLRAESICRGTAP